ncbi:response regulator [Litoreibacter sp.]|nr:response regulator [Litoreibacter sp.]
MAKILLMEDDIPFSDVLTALLTSSNHQVTQCASATEARTHIEVTEFDLLITDILVYQGNSPVPDGGISLINWLRGPLSSRRERWMRDMPIIAISGAIHKHGMSDILKLSQELGADITLAKPAAPKDLLGAIRRLCPT